MPGMLSLQRVDSLTKPKTLDLFLDYPPVSVERFMGKHIAILGVTGSGKSMTGGTLLEKLIGAGFKALVIDIEGDYHTLAKLYPGKVAVFGHKRSEKSPGINAAGLRKMVSRIIDDRVSAVLVVRQYSTEERLAIIREALELFYARMDGESPNMVVMVYLAEVHLYCPQSGAEDGDLSKLISITYAKLGRKRGITLVVDSQRPADVNKGLLTQCRIKFLHGVDYPTDIDTYSAIVDVGGESRQQNRAFVRGMVRRFAPGQCLFVYPALGDEYDSGFRRVHVRPRESHHPSRTPGLEALD